MIESVDREKIAQALAEEMAKAGKRPRLFVQVNTGAEPQKAGVLPQEADAFHRALPRRLRARRFAGLMCVPPVDEQASPHFALLADIAERNGLHELSMGMSSDFELAIQLGATYVRVGSAIMGERDYSSRPADLRQRARRCSRLSYPTVPPQPRQQARHIPRPERHAACGRRKLLRRDVEENGAAPAERARRIL